MTRFQAGDVVVLNGHRLTVEPIGSMKGYVYLSAQPGRRPIVGVPEEWLPDPEPREEPPALTPGMTVAHEDGRFGVVNSIFDDGDCTWTPVGSSAAFYVRKTRLRPVTLVEKPDREAAADAILTTLQRRANVNLTKGTALAVLDALFSDKS